MDAGEKWISIDIDTRKLDIALRFFPKALKYELADSLDHISRSFFKLWRRETGVKMNPSGIFHRFRRVLRATGSEGIKGEYKLLDIHGSQSETTKVIAETAKSALDMRLDIFSSSKVAGIQERGGRVKAKQGMMVIPISPKAERFQQGLESGGYKISDFKLTNLIPVKLRTGLFLALKKKRGRIEPIFALKREVTIEPRLNFYRTWAHMAEKRTKYLNQALTNAIERI